MVMPQSGFLQVALIVAEATTLTPPQIASLRTYDVLLAGCGWFRGVLAEHGLPSYRFPQGVDTLTFAPGRQRPPRTPNDPFLIFSGGKFEYRKGHDLVLESFKQLRRRFPEIPAKLVCAWHNAWPDTIGDLHHTGRLTSLPTFDPETKTWNFAAWLTTQRLDPADVMVCPPMFPEQMAAVVRECDAGLFLSRAEGNANMAMAEVLACGIPCLASGTTGHLEYLTEPLVTLASTWPTHRVPAGYAGAEGWGEVKPTEIAAYLAAMAKEAPDPSLHYARDFAETWGWDARAAALCEILEPMLP